MRILFPTNLTEPPEITAEVERLARLLEADVFVLHVIAPAPTAAVTPMDPMTGLTGFAPYTLYDPGLEADMDEAEASAFEAFLADRFTIPIHAGIRKGDPADLILDDADEHDVDMIIMGKRRHGRLEQLLVGSTASDVLKGTTRPTLVLPVKREDKD